MSLGLLVHTQPGSSAPAPADDGWEWEEEGSGFDWGSNIQTWLELTPNIISAAKGHPYASTPYGPSSYPTGPQTGSGVYGGGSVAGISGFGQISGTTLVLIGLAAILLLRRR